MSSMSRLAASIKDCKTKVIFRKFKDGEIIALFPEIPGNNSVLTCMNYMHEGQHGTGNATLESTKQALFSEYSSLFKELTAIGYNLKVVSRFSYEMDQKRIASLRASRA